MKPGRILFVSALLWLLLAAAAFFSEPVSLIWFLFGITLLPFILADALFLLLLTDRLHINREIAASLALGVPVPVTLRIERGGRGALPAGIRLFDLYPASVNCSAFPAVLKRGELKKGRVLIFTYTVLPVERGNWTFPGAELLLASPLRFWQLRVTHRCTNRGRTYPDFKKIRETAGKDLRGIPERIGLKAIRKRGQGLEFESLREYQEGDAVRAIDWLATSRRRKIIIREYREEQDQQVLFLLDSGYRLHRREGEIDREGGGGMEPGSSGGLWFDHALNGVLLLAYVALKHGDAVAVGSFGNGERWCPPRKGTGALTALMNSLYDLKSAPVPSSPSAALESALARLRRRTFIILISNFREEDGESLSRILRGIGKRHLLLLVSLRELEAETLAFRHPANPGEAPEIAAAFSYLASRRRLYRNWEHLGLLTLETSSAELSPALINRYLKVKRSGRL
ncbi:MAG: DUF58 domain-containing protein [Treponema sp.]|jgi:uncharacterized protein (DUF58 family)|nr:DUF58 domain-containing protein [Treponema sp.]